MTLQSQLGPLSRLHAAGNSSEPRATPEADSALVRLKSAVLRPALGSGGVSGGPCDLAAVWQRILDGELVYVGQGSGPRGRYALCRKAARAKLLGPFLSGIETALLVRVLWGEQQKRVAGNLGMACSTASKWHGSAVEKLQLKAGPVALPLVLAAQAWASGASRLSAVRMLAIDGKDGEYALITVPRPSARNEERISPAEREIAELLVEGWSRDEIAERRTTSTQTVSCQFQSIFRKLRAGGRCELIKYAVAAGWFPDPGIEGPLQEVAIDFGSGARLGGRPGCIKS